jgi:hypothetical protein
MSQWTKRPVGRNVQWKFHTGTSGHQATATFSCHGKLLPLFFAKLCTGVAPFNQSPKGGGGAKNVEVDCHGTVGFPKCKTPPSSGGTPPTSCPQAKLSLANDASDTYIGGVMQQKLGDHWLPLDFSPEN